MNVSGLSMIVRQFSAGLHTAPAQEVSRIVIHVGKTVAKECRRGEHSYAGLSVHGDLDIVPAGLDSKWVLKESDTALVIGISSSLLRRAANTTEVDSPNIVLLNRFTARDPQLESLAWALKIESDEGFGNGTLYWESVAMAISVRLVRRHSPVTSQSGERTAGMSGQMLRKVVAFIEDHLGEPLSLAQISAVSGLSISHFQRAFCIAMGKPLHRYVIQRRVARAHDLLLNTDRPIQVIALEVGFCHQSHLAAHMRKVFGVAPTSLRRK
jgi:AraC family transcriptional regulator